MIYHFESADAEKFGVNAAILLSALRGWIAKNKANDRNQKDGRTWTYNSVAAWSKLMPFLTPKQVRTALEVLVTKGEIVTGCYNENAYDRTAWYALSTEAPFCPVGQMNPPPAANESAPEGKTLDQGSTIGKTKRAPMEFPPIPLTLQTPGFATAWAEWLGYRRESGKPIKATTAQKQFAFLEKLGVARAILSINNSIQNQWQGLFEPRSSNATTPPPRPNARFFASAETYPGFTNK